MLMPIPQRVLVKEVNWLGDVVMTLPALRAVRQAAPQAHLAMLIKRELSSFFTARAGSTRSFLTRSRVACAGSLTGVTSLHRSARAVSTWPSSSPRASKPRSG